MFVLRKDTRLLVCALSILVSSDLEIDIDQSLKYILVEQVIIFVTGMVLFGSAAFGHKNIMALKYAVLVCEFYWLMQYKVMDKNKRAFIYIATIISTLLMYGFTRSATGLVFTMILLGLIALSKVKVGKKILLSKVTMLAFAEMAVFNFLICKFYHQIANSMFGFLLIQFDKICSSRIILGYEAMKRYGIKLFGNSISYSKVHGSSYFNIDSGYMWVLLGYGIIYMIIFIIVMSLIIRKMQSRQEFIRVGVLACLALYGFSEDIYLSVGFNFVVFYWYSYLGAIREKSEITHNRAERTNMGAKITVFTPTYNRAKLLEKLYESLKIQSYEDFEWLIVDDDSNDDTDKKVKTWIDDGQITIRYEKQAHGGKHRAINRAVELAEGELFFIVDSDDYLLQNSLELLAEWYNSIKENAEIGGIAGLRVSPKGKCWGGEVSIGNREYIDASNFERERYHLLGDKAEAYRTEVMRRFPFPEFDGEYFVTEAVCWDAIASAGYKVRWYNEPIYICDYLEDGLTKTGANDYIGHKSNLNGYLFYIKQCIKIKKKSDGVVNFREYNNFCKFNSIEMKERAHNIDFTLMHYLCYLCLELPIFYVMRKIKTTYYKLR